MRNQFVDNIARCAKELAARMSQSSGRDSADGIAAVSIRHTVTRRSVSWARPGLLGPRNRFPCLSRKRPLYKL